MDDLGIIQSKIRQRMNDIADELANGACESYESYQHLCGVIKGLAYAEREILDIYQAQQVSDE